MSDKNWWDGLTDFQCDQPVLNDEPLIWCPDWMRTLFYRIPIEKLVFLDEGGCINPVDFDPLRDNLVYKLNRRWQKPAPEPVGRWEHCRITKPYDRWVFTDPYMDEVTTLSRAVDIPGFGGIEFEEWPDRWFRKLIGVTSGGHPIDNERGTDDCKPATPKRCRFWVGK